MTTGLRFNVFVYGTLRRGEGNHRLLESARFVGAGRTVKAMTMIDVCGAFPAVVTGPGPSRIVGEVYAVDDETLLRLDRLEGVPHFYDRDVFVIELEGGEQVCAMTYVQREADGRPVIASGDWLDR